LRHSRCQIGLADLAGFSQLSHAHTVPPIA
jgi:hypothetical protein